MEVGLGIANALQSTNRHHRGISGLHQLVAAPIINDGFLVQFLNIQCIEFRSCAAHWFLV